jgi:hypothetical protein
VLNEKDPVRCCTDLSKDHAIIRSGVYSDDAAGKQVGEGKYIFVADLCIKKILTRYL